MTRVSDVLGELSDEDVQWIVSAGERRDVREGSTLIVEGELPTALFMILEGELSVFSAAGREIRRLPVGDMVGELSFADGGPASATVRAPEDAVVFAIPRPQLDAKLALDPGFAARFYRTMSVFLAHRLRNQWSTERAVATAAGGEDENRFLRNVHLAAARSERLRARLQGPSAVTLTGNDLSIESVVRVAYAQAPVDVSPLAREQLVRSAAVVNELALEPGPVYGLSTGLGAFSSKPIARAENERFQCNRAIRSRAHTERCQRSRRLLPRTVSPLWRDLRCCSPPP